MGFAAQPATGLVPGPTGPLLTSIGIHAVLLTALVVSFERGSRYEVPPGALAIQAVVVDQDVLKRAMPRLPAIDPDVERRLQAERDRQAQQEREAQARREQEAREAQEARQAEAARQATLAREAEQARQTEIARKVEAERLAKAKAEREARAAREAEEARKAEAARKAQAAREAEAARKAEEARVVAAEQARQQQAARQAAVRREIEANERALIAQMEAEEAYMSAASSGLLDEYQTLIGQKVERNWLKPPGTPENLDCEVRVTQIPGGEVVDVRIVRCNGDAAVYRSIEAAVYRASPLPLPADPSLFDRNITFLFRPED